VDKTPVSRSAAIVAAVGAGFGVADAVVATVVFRTHANPLIPDNPRLLPWMIAPLTLGGVAIAAVRTRSVGLVWATIGALLGFIVISGFSFGPFFACEGLATLATGFVHLEDIRPRWRMFLVPRWSVAAASGICLPLMAVSLLSGGEFGSAGVSGSRRESYSVVNGVRVTQTYQTYSASMSPVIVWGAWLCTGTLTFLALSDRGHPASRGSSRRGARLKQLEPDTRYVVRLKADATHCHAA
jgi:hypothetical protein